ncbi:MAG: hypothetical protein ACRDZ9_02455 [Acidimicrobiales bacterium]
MSIAGIVTIAAVGVLVGAVALYLIVIAAILQRVSFTVGTVLIGVRAIADQVQPVGSVVNDIVSDVRAIEETLASLPLGERRPELTAGRASRRITPRG